MVHNCNAITLYAEENQTVDETTWGHAGFGEAGSGLTGRLMNKKVNKGGQTTIMTNSRRFRPHAYIHRHKMHNPKGMTRKGCVEMVHLIESINSLIINPPAPRTNSNRTTNPTDATATSAPLPRTDNSTSQPRQTTNSSNATPWLISTPAPDPSKKQIFRNKNLRTQEIVQTSYSKHASQKNNLKTQKS